MANELRLSVSKVKCFIDCKKKYKFVYVDKLPRKVWEHHTLGKVCHKVLEDFHKSYIEGSKEPYHIVMSRAFKGAVTKYKDYITLSMKSECWKIIDEYLRKITESKKQQKLPNIIACEKEFEFSINEDIILRGAIDRIQIDKDDTLHVIDYKTTKNANYLVGDYFQLLTYAYVLSQEDLSIHKIRASYVLLKHSFNYITTTFSDSEIAKIKDKYIEYGRQILEEKRFAPHVSQLCRWCDHLAVCEEGLKFLNPQITYGKTDW